MSNGSTTSPLQAPRASLSDPLPRSAMSLPACDVTNHISLASDQKIASRYLGKFAMEPRVNLQDVMLTPEKLAQLTPSPRSLTRRSQDPRPKTEPLYLPKSFGIDRAFPKSQPSAPRRGRPSKNKQPSASKTQSQKVAKENKANPMFALRRRRSKDVEAPGSQATQPALSFSLKTVVVNDSDDAFEPTKVCRLTPPKRKGSKRKVVANEASQRSKRRKSEVVDLTSPQKKDSSTLEMELEPLLKFGRRRDEGKRPVVKMELSEESQGPDLQVKREMLEEDGFFLNICGEKHSLEEEILGNGVSQLEENGLEKLKKETEEEEEEEVEKFRNCKRRLYFEAEAAGGKESGKRGEWKDAWMKDVVKNIKKDISLTQKTKINGHGSGIMKNHCDTPDSSPVSPVAKCDTTPTFVISSGSSGKSMPKIIDYEVVKNPFNINHRIKKETQEICEPSKPEASDEAKTNGLPVLEDCHPDTIENELQQMMSQPGSDLAAKLPPNLTKFGEDHRNSLLDILDTRCSSLDGFFSDTEQNGKDTQKANALTQDNLKKHDKKTLTSPLSPDVIFKAFYEGQPSGFGEVAQPFGKTAVLPKPTLFGTSSESSSSSSDPSSDSDSSSSDESDGEEDKTTVENTDMEEKEKEKGKKSKEIEEKSKEIEEKKSKEVEKEKSKEVEKEKEVVLEKTVVEETMELEEEETVLENERNSAGSESTDDDVISLFAENLLSDLESDFSPAAKKPKAKLETKAKPEPKAKSEPKAKPEPKAQPKPKPKPQEPAKPATPPRSKPVPITFDPRSLASPKKVRITTNSTQQGKSEVRTRANPQVIRIPVQVPRIFSEKPAAVKAPSVQQQKAPPALQQKAPPALQQKAQSVLQQKAPPVLQQKAPPASQQKAPPVSQNGPIFRSDDRTAFMEQDFNQAFGNASFGEIGNPLFPVPILHNGLPPVTNWPVNQRAQVEQKTAVFSKAILKQNGPSFQMGNILKLDEKQMRMGQNDKELFQGMCFQYMRQGICGNQKNNCPFKHEFTDHRSRLRSTSKEFIFTLAKVALSQRFFYYLRCTFHVVLDILPYPEACEYFRLIYREIDLLERADTLDNTVQLLASKPNASLSRVMADLSPADQLAQRRIFDAIKKRIKPGQFWDTFRSFFHDNVASGECLDAIVSECVLARKNHAHIKDVLSYMYYLKHDRNAPVVVSSEYLQAFVDIVRRERLNDFLEVLGVKDVPRSPSPKVGVGAGRGGGGGGGGGREWEGEDEEDLEIGIQEAEVEAIMNEVGISAEEIMEECERDLEREREKEKAKKPQRKGRKKKAAPKVGEEGEGEKEEDGSYRLVVMDVPEARSRYHDSFGELNEDLYRIEVALKQKDYLAAVNILKKYHVDLEGNPYHITAYQRCYQIIRRIGQSIAKSGDKAFKHEREFWLFIRDLTNVKTWLATGEFASIVATFKRYVESASQAKRNSFINVCYLVLRAEIQLAENYFMLIQQEAVHRGAQDGLLKALLELGMRVLFALIDGNRWFNAFVLIKRLKSCPCDAKLTMLKALIYVANQREEKAYELLRSTRILFGNREKWLVPSHQKDLHLRHVVVQKLLQALIPEHVEMAFVMFETLVYDQNGVSHPIDLTSYVDFLAVRLVSENNMESLVKLSWLVMKHLIFLKEPIFRLLVTELTRYDVDCGKQFFDYACKCDIYYSCQNINASNIILKSRLDSTEEELFLMISEFLHQLSIHCGSGIEHIHLRSFKIFIIFEAIPSVYSKRLNSDELKHHSLVLQDEQCYETVRTLETVLAKRFFPPIRLTLGQNRGRLVRLQNKSVIAYLRHYILQ